MEGLLMGTLQFCEIHLVDVGTADKFTCLVISYHTRDGIPC